MLCRPELEEPHALPRSQRLAHQSAHRQHEPKQRLTNFPSLMGTVTLAPINELLTCAGKSSGPIVISNAPLPQPTQTHPRHHVDTAPPPLVPPRAQSGPACRSCRGGHPTHHISALATSHGEKRGLTESQFSFKVNPQLVCCTKRCNSPTLYGLISAPSSFMTKSVMR